MEVMISISLLTILVAVIGGALALTHRSIEKGEKKIETGERLRSSLGILDSQIQSSLPATEGEGADRRFIFDGDRQTLRFATAASVWGGRKGPVVAEYSLRDGGPGRSALVLAERGIGMQGKSETVLLADLDGLSFEYFYRKPLEEAGAWTDRWKEPDVLPEKIRIHLVRNGRETVYPVPIRVAARLSQGTVSYAVTKIN